MADRTLHADDLPEGSPPPRGGTRRLAALAFAALGVVFGDIGTSPLYALREAVRPQHGIAPGPENILGVLSLIFWTLTLVVSVKYLTFVMRADNQGEGGIFALLALLPEHVRSPRSKAPAKLGGIAGLVVFGAALLYGDGIITPAISVLSAVEGLEVATSVFRPAIVPITCAILVLLFSIQHRGTERVGRMFAPVMVLWFASIAALGAWFVARNPTVLHALDPRHAALFLGTHGFRGFAVLGSVVLAITGAEALYADMGHFGRGPIRAGWYGLVFPALVLNYFGQGALLLQHPKAAGNPFFALVPRGPLTYALVALSTAATVIASQALISGAYSLTYQAAQLGYLPRVDIRHTSTETEGQIYVPGVNLALAIACIGLVLWFRHSSRLAAAYGIAVTGTMAITSIVYFVVLRRTWRWRLAAAAPLLALFLSIDLPFFGANLLKLVDGGYIPVLVALGLFTLMATWKRGRALLALCLRRQTEGARHLVERLLAASAARVPGSAVFLSSSAIDYPPVLIHHAKHNKVLHQVVLMLTVRTEHVPRLSADERALVQRLGPGFYRVTIRTGFMQRSDVPLLLRAAAARYALPVDLDDLTYYLGREKILATDAGHMRRLQERLFRLMARNATSADSYFNIPPDQVVELGIQVEL